MADQENTDATSDNNTQDQQPETSEQLGDNGLKALQAEREARRDLEKRLKVYEDRDKTETQRLQEQLAEAQARADQLAAQAETRSKLDAIRTAASEAGAIDTDAVTALIADDVELGDDNGTSSAKQAIKVLATKKPHLFDTRPTGYRDGQPKTGATKQSTADLFADAINSI